MVHQEKKCDICHSIHTSCSRDVTGSAAIGSGEVKAAGLLGDRGTALDVGVDGVPSWRWMDAALPAPDCCSAVLRGGIGVLRVDGVATGRLSTPLCTPDCCLLVCKQEILVQQSIFQPTTHNPPLTYIRLDGLLPLPARPAGRSRRATLAPPRRLDACGQRGTAIPRNVEAMAGGQTLRSSSHETV